MIFQFPPVVAGSGGGGGGGTPGGSDTQLQFNNAGSFGGITGATTDGATVTLTTPTIASFTNATHDHEDAAGGGQLNATNVFSAGTVPTARLGSGTADNTTFLRGDQTWAVPAGGGGGGVAMGTIQAVTMGYANTWITALS